MFKHRLYLVNFYKPYQINWWWRTLIYNILLSLLILLETWDFFKIVVIFSFWDLIYISNSKIRIFNFKEKILMADVFSRWFGPMRQLYYNNKKKY